MSTQLSMMPDTTGMNPYGVHMGFIPTLIIVLIVLLLISRFVGKFFDFYKDIKEERRKDAAEVRAQAAETREQRRFEHEVSEWDKSVQKDSSFSTPKPRTKKEPWLHEKIAL